MVFHPIGISSVDTELFVSTTIKEPRNRNADDLPLYIIKFYIYQHRDIVCGTITKIQRSLFNIITIVNMYDLHSIRMHLHYMTKESKSQ